MRSKIRCDQCDYQAYYKHHLKEHVEYKHEGVIYQCDFCDYKARTKQNLQFLSGLSEPKNLFICYLCKIEFVSNEFLKEHIKPFADVYKCNDLMKRNISDLYVTINGMRVIKLIIVEQN